MCRDFLSYVCFAFAVFVGVHVCKLVRAGCYKALGSLARDAKNAAAMAEPAYQRLCANFGLFLHVSAFVCILIPGTFGVCMDAVISIVLMY